MHLTDCFMELMAYVVYFQRTSQKRQPPFEQVKADVTRLLSQSEALSRKGEISREEFDTARFAVCAWVGRGAPRALAVVLPAWGILVLGAATIPLDEIAAPETLVNTLTPSGLAAFSDGWARAVLVGCAVLAGVVVVAVPRRHAWTAVALVVAGLVLDPNVVVGALHDVGVTVVAEFVPDESNRARSRGHDAIHRIVILPREIDGERQGMREVILPYPHVRAVLVRNTIHKEALIRRGARCHPGERQTERNSLHDNLGSNGPHSARERTRTGCGVLSGCLHTRGQLVIV